MKKTLISILYLFVGFFLFSEGFYLSPNISLKNGTAKEYVFEGDCKVSQLDWQVENQVNLGLDVDFEFKKFFLGLGFSTGLYNFGGMWTMLSKQPSNKELPRKLMASDLFTKAVCFLSYFLPADAFVM